MEGDERGAALMAHFHAPFCVVVSRQAPYTRSLWMIENESTTEPSATLTCSNSSTEAFCSTTREYVLPVSRGSRVHSSFGGPKKSHSGGGAAPEQT